MSESTGFSAAEQAAIAERAQELRAQRGGRKTVSYTHLTLPTILLV